MEDLNKMRVRELIDLWCHLSTPNFDLHFAAEDKYHETRHDIETLIARRLNFRLKDTRMFLNNKRVFLEEQKEIYVRKNWLMRDKRCKKRRHG